MMKGGGDSPRVLLVLHKQFSIFHFSCLFIIMELPTEPQSMQRSINMRKLHVVWARYIYCLRHVATVGGMDCRVALAV